jgi:hypothetical protein
VAAEIRLYGWPRLSIETSVVMRRNTVHDFWPKVARGEFDKCWPWSAGTRDRYGIFSYHGRDYRAHRFAYWLTKSDWPPVVRHMCDNPPCCNPRHLLPRTQQDNIRDREERGRRKAPRGQDHPNARLTSQDVHAIRRRAVAGERQTLLALEFGVCVSTINNVVLGKTWRES